MLVLAGFVGGTIWGGYLARRRKGDRLDMLQYATSSGIVFGLLAYFASLIFLRIIS
ncbi:MAG: hypothetical protein RIE24_08275 [Silicimonas sp.]|jgi:membrane associated rhomboid family serine protease|uniref:Acyltransferase n=1 Tax=Roseovarius atlanticus TaxID=1641875 RepID=A0A0T5NNQ0_9RHOB|nr:MULTISPECIES: hypothetical protein [Roseovarius]KRS10613.1 acyltransferase [Roseovarius atlanticus]MDD9727681.1 hypothetical protein [Roseovarius sp. SK2]QFT83182.1 hypothetical protein FIU89_21355 [Roseovarius sp. THAF27]QFT95268.1 hypothetical protein FIU86_20625 [Roseovarius sp. THAF9]QFT99724.1 hypothetical protein FIU85_20570 [Roseovarius sp. THAF8]